MLATLGLQNFIGTSITMICVAKGAPLFSSEIRCQLSEVDSSTSALVQSEKTERKCADTLRSDILSLGLSLFLRTSALLDSVTGERVVYWNAIGNLAFKACAK